MFRFGLGSETLHPASKLEAATRRDELADTDLLQTPRSTLRVVDSRLRSSQRHRYRLDPLAHGTDHSVEIAP